MKTRRTFVSILAALSIFISCTPRSFASSATDPDSILLKRGYPQEVLDSLSEALKETLSKGNETYIGSSTALYTIESDGGVNDLTRGQISTSELELSFLVTKPEGETYDRTSVTVTYEYKWLTLPTMRLEDIISVSWDNSIFILRDDSFEKIDQYDAYVYSSGLVKGIIQSQEAGYASASSVGVSWYADIPAGNSYVSPSSIYGSGQFILDVAEDCTKTGSTVLYGHYVHSTIDISLSVNIASYGSFSVSGLGSYDERGSQVTLRLDDGKIVSEVA